MLTPVFENRFKKDIKRLQKRGKDMQNRITETHLFLVRSGTHSDLF